MKSAFLISVILYLTGSNCWCQTLEEWIKQSATQKKYLLQQITGLQLYLDYLNKGYTIAKSGLNTISEYKSGHNFLDKRYFSSLEQVNPTILKSKKAEQIKALYPVVIEKCNSINRLLLNEKLLTLNEKRYIKRVLQSFVQNCREHNNQFISILTPHLFTMSDKDRVCYINEIYGNMVGSLEFAYKLNDDLKLLVIQRKKEQKETGLMQLSYK
ncbi:MAG: hypothetical protein V4717_14460 [Bacteroidota bacterium]